MKFPNHIGKIAIGLLMLLLIFLYVNRDPVTGCMFACENNVTDGTGTYRINNGKRIKIK